MIHGDYARIIHGCSRNRPGADQPYRSLVMKLESIREIIKRRDGATDSDVDDLFHDCAMYAEEGEDPEEILLEVFGLEPDYLFDGEFATAIGF